MKEKGVGGANTNKNGLPFEKDTNLEDLLRAACYSVTGREVRARNTLVGYLGPNHKLYDLLSEQSGLAITPKEFQSRLASKLLPDDSFLNLQSKTLFVIEKKWIQGAGSVDEKPQGVPFKIRQYRKLLEGTGFEIKFLFLFNCWWTQPRYRDLHEYLLEQNVQYFFNQLPLKAIGLEETLCEAPAFESGPECVHHKGPLAECADKWNPGKKGKK